MPRRPESDPAPLHEARFRLLGGDPSPRRTIVIGPAILLQSGDLRGPWTLSVAAVGSLEPIAPRCPRRLSRTVSRFARHGVRCRLASAIAIPVDFTRQGWAHGPLPGEGRFTGRSEGIVPCRSAGPRMIYGWSLAYRFPDSNGPALVDPHEDVPDLPAFYESAVELIDRAFHLEARGIETRPIAILVHEDDYVRDGRGGRVNRYFPKASFRP